VGNLHLQAVRVFRDHRIVAESQPPTFSKPIGKVWPFLRIMHAKAVRERRARGSWAMHLRLRTHHAGG